MHIFQTKSFFFLKNQTCHHVLFVKRKMKLYSIFFYCPSLRNLWAQLKFYLSEDLILPPQTLQAAVFDFSEIGNMENVILLTIFFLFLNFTFINHSREKEFLSVMSLVNQIMKITKSHFTLEKSVLSIIKNGEKQV